MELNNAISDMQALAMRWTQAQPTVAAFISALVPNYHDREDLLQKTAASLVTLYRHYDPAQPFVGWAIGVARIEVLRHRQLKQRDRASFDTDTIESIAAAIERTHLESRDLANQIQHCLSKLTSRVQKIVQFYYVEELRPAAIAERLACTPQVVFLTLHRARTSLRVCLERSFPAEERAR